MLHLYRHTLPAHTLGVMHYKAVPQCLILEDPASKGYLKVDKVTRIPGGLYDVVPQTFGRYHSLIMERITSPDPQFADYKELKGIYCGMPLVKDVHGYEGILIHWGVEVAHTDGCLLTGDGYNMQAAKLQDSVKAFVRLYTAIQPELKALTLKLKITDL